MHVRLGTRSLSGRTHETAGHCWRVRPLHVGVRLGTVSLSGRGSMPDVLLMGELQGTYQSDNRDNNNYSRINQPAECTGYNTDKTKVAISILKATFSFPCASFCALLLLRFCLRAGSGGRVVSKQNWSQDTENTSVFCPSVLLKLRWNANPELWFHTEAHKTRCKYQGCMHEAAIYTWPIKVNMWKIAMSINRLQHWMHCYKSQSTMTSRLAQYWENRFARLSQSSFVFRWLDLSWKINGITCHCFHYFCSFCLCLSLSLSPSPSPSLPPSPLFWNLVAMLYKI